MSPACAFAVIVRRASTTDDNWAASGQPGAIDRVRTARNDKRNSSCNSE